MNQVGMFSLFFEPCSIREFGTNLLQPAVLQQCTGFLADLCSGTGLIGQLRCEGPASSTPSDGAKLLSLLVLIISLSTMCQPSVGGILTECSATTKFLIVFVLLCIYKKGIGAELYVFGLSFFDEPIMLLSASHCIRLKSILQLLHA